MNEKQWSLPLRFLTFGMLIILFAIGVWIVQPVLQPLIIAAFIAYLIHPAVVFLTTRTRMPRRGAVVLTFCIAVLFMFGAPASMTLFLEEFQQIVRDIGILFNQLTVWLADVQTIGDFTLDFTQAAARLEEFRATFIPSLVENALQLLEQTSMGALWIIVTLVAVYYFLSEGPRLMERTIHSFPADFQPEVEELFRRLKWVWMNYLRSQILLMVIVGVVFSVAWTILGIPGALVLGIVAGFLTIIPDVGPFIAAILATAVALLEGSTWMTLPNIGVAVIVVVVYLILIAIKNFWLRPFILGRSVHMPEALVFIFIIMATVLWGILGALLVIPVVASLGILIDYLRRRILGMTPFAEPFPGTRQKPPPPTPKLHIKRAREKKIE
jgi:predicted PurR-regulated permease PerM